MKKILFIILSAVLLCGCGSSKGGKKPKPCKGNTCTQMYVEQPDTFAILPPFNNEIGEEDKNTFLRSIYVYLGSKGYNLIENKTMVDKLLEANMVNYKQLIGADCSTYKSLLGADAVLFTTILKKDHESEGLVVSADYVLKSTSSGQVLYHRVVTVVKPTSSVNVGNGLWGAVLSAGLTMAKDAITTNYDELFDKCNELAFKDLPYGPKHSKYNTDQTDRTGYETIEYTLE